MIISLRYLVVLPSLMTIIGCVPSSYDIKDSYNRASKSFNQTIHSLEEKIVTKFNDLQVLEAPKFDKKKPSQIENIETILSKKNIESKKDIYNLEAPFRDMIIDVISVHPEVQSAYYLEKAAEQEIVASKGQNKPQITGSLNAGGVKENTNTSDITTGVALDARISQLIYDGGYLAGSIGKKNALYEQAKSNSAMVKNRIGFEAASSWLDLWVLREKLKEINYTSEDTNPILADIKRVAKTGLIDRTVVDNIEKSLLQVTVNKQKLEMDIELAELRYEYFYGKVPIDIIKPVSPFKLDLLENKMKNKSSIPKLRFAAAQLMASREDENSILGEFKPQVSFNLAASSPLDRDDNASLAIGIQSTYTFSDGGTRKARLKVAQAKSSELEFSLDNEKIMTMKLIETDLKSLNYLKKSRLITQKKFTTKYSVFDYSQITNFDGSIKVK
jgi:outer membrane protein TolC